MDGATALREGQGAFGQGLTRAGSRALSIFGYSLNARVLREHASGPRTTPDLRRSIGWAPGTTLRKSIAGLVGVGALTIERGETAKPNRTELTESGEELLVVADRVTEWLSAAPGESLDPDDRGAVRAIRALVEGWEARIIDPLAERPHPAADILRRIDLSIDSMERRLSMLRNFGLVDRPQTGRKPRSQEVTDWLRGAVAPLFAAWRWERRHLSPWPPVDGADVLAASRLLSGLAKAPLEEDGFIACAILTDRTVPKGAGSERRQREGVRVTFAVGGGLVSVFEAVRRAEPRGWALGTVEGWLGALIDDEADKLRFRGDDPEMAARLCRYLHEALTA